MHHAHLYRHEKELPDLSHVHEADIIREHSVRLSIDRVRTLIQEVFQKPFTPDGQRAVVIVTEMIPVEAQNALLKILEEPPTATIFHIVVMDHSRLLPTLKSRFEIPHHIHTKDSDVQVGKDFLKSSYQERLTLVAEKTAAKDTEWHKQLLNELEILSLEATISHNEARTVFFVRERISGPGASAKMLLEHLALTLPVIQ